MIGKQVSLIKIIHCSSSASPSVSITKLARPFVLHEDITSSTYCAKFHNILIQLLKKKFHDVV